MSTPVFAEEAKIAVLKDVTEDDAHDVHDVETKKIVVDEKRVEQWVLADQRDEGYVASQDGFAVIYNISGGSKINFSISLAYGAVSVGLSRASAIGDSTTGATGYKMEIPADGHSYVLLTKNTIEAKQYGIYERLAGTDLPWKLVATEEEARIVKTELRRVDVDNLRYYDYI